MTDGGGLRAQLESTLADSQAKDEIIVALKEQLQTYIVREVAEKYSLVKPEDLTGFDTVEEADAGGQSLQESRTEEQTTLLKSAGLDDERIAVVLAGGQIDGGGELDPDLAALSKNQGGGNGKVPPIVDKGATFGPSAIKAHFNTEKAASK